MKVLNYNSQSILFWRLKTGHMKWFVEEELVSVFPPVFSFSFPKNSDSF